MGVVSVIVVAGVFFVVVIVVNDSNPPSSFFLLLLFSLFPSLPPFSSPLSPFFYLIRPHSLKRKPGRGVGAFDLACVIVSHAKLSTKELEWHLALPTSAAH